MKTRIVGHTLPGRTFCEPDGTPLTNVHVAVQVRRDPFGAMPADADEATWEVGVECIAADDGTFDFRGPAVHGKRGSRFLYLTWGNVADDGTFEMFRRAKLMLADIDTDLVARAATGPTLVGSVSLSDECGHPRCGRVDAPAIVWSVIA